MRRRDFLSLLAAALGVRSFAANAQQPTMPVIGFLSIGTPDRVAAYLSAWRKGLHAAGFVEGNNLVVEYRWTGRNDQFPAVAAELVTRRVALIMATSGVAAKAAKSDPSTIPIVFTRAV